MTTPTERTRALRWAFEFMTEIQRSPVCTDAMRREAKVILRHYPTPQEIKHWAEFNGVEEPLMVWLGPEPKTSNGGGEN